MVNSERRCESEGLGDKHSFRQTCILGSETARRFGVLKVCNDEEGWSTFPCIKDVMVHVTLDPAVRLTAQPPRGIPLAIERTVEKEIAKLLRMDIIEPVAKCSFCQSPMLVVPGRVGSVRVCVNM